MAESWKIFRSCSKAQADARGALRTSRLRRGLPDSPLPECKRSFMP